MAGNTKSTVNLASTEPPRFTPGPWMFLDSHAVGGMAIVPSDGPAIVPSFWPPDSSIRVPIREHRANGHLIAAAPDLYAALFAVGTIYCENNCILTGEEHDAICLANAAALAKARGE